METPSTARAAHLAASTRPATVLAIVGSAVLAGVGLLGTMYWLLTQRWLYFASLAPLVAGAYLLFTRATGPDRA